VPLPDGRLQHRSSSAEEKRADTLEAVTEATDRDCLKTFAVVLFIAEPSYVIRLQDTALVLRRL
jgi:hypothetical protein